MTAHRLPLLAASGPGIARPAQVPQPPAPAAAVTTDEVRQLIYDREESWGWVVEFEAGTDGLAAIYEDGQGDMWRIPITVAADDSISLGEAVPVRMVFVQTTDDGRSAPLAASLAAAGSRRTIARFAPADPTSVRTTRTATDTRLTVSTTTTDEDEETSMDEETLAHLRQRYGLAEDATSEDILAAVAAAQPDPTDDDDPADPAPTDDDPEEEEGAAGPAAATVTVSARRFRDMETQLAQLAARDANRTEAEQRTHRDQVIAGAVSTGRITPAERQSWRDALDEAPVATEQLIAGLQPQRRVPLVEIGSSDGADDDVEARYKALTTGAPTYGKR